MTHDYRTLSFQLNITTQTSEKFDQAGASTDGPPYRSVEPRPLVDGMPLSLSYWFDALALLTWGTHSGAVDLFTCSCGVAGCAGIFEDTLVEVTDTHVAWTFPDDPFRGRLHEGLFAPGAPLTVRFERAHYDSALQALEQELLALAADGGLPVVIAPELPEIADLDKPLATVLEQTRARVAAARRQAAPRYLAQSDIDVAVDVFARLEQYAAPEEKAKYRRHAADIRTLMEDAARQAPVTCVGLHPLAARIRRPDDTDEDAFAALFQLLGYLTGAYGPYDIEFQHDGKPLSHVKSTAEGWDIRDESGAPLSNDEVFIMLRRRPTREPASHAALALSGDLLSKPA